MEASIIILFIISTCSLVLSLYNRYKIKDVEGEINYKHGILKDSFNSDISYHNMFIDAQREDIKNINRDIRLIHEYLNVERVIEPQKMSLKKKDHPNKQEH